MQSKPVKFQKLLLTWFDKHGRKNLPWQQPRSPYRVWVSEVMLQQTQVATVIPYFKKFIARFPNVTRLANAHLDDVLHAWAGLGFYARARNLHRTAQIIQQDFAGKFPADLQTLQKLPGIGRSTAGAILALSMNQPAPILDGNVKRVLTRFGAIGGWPGSTETLKNLWDLADQYVAHDRPADYTQAVMDLGSLVCTPKQPSCPQCPLHKHCMAYQQNTVTNYPEAKLAKPIPTKNIFMLVLHDRDQKILLERNPPTGIWGGLWSLPQLELSENIQQIKQWCKTNYHCETAKIKMNPIFRHTFSHFHLQITPVFVAVKKWRPPAMESNTRVWYNLAQIKTKGLATPVKKILANFSEALMYD